MNTAWRPVVAAACAGALGVTVAACGASALGAGEQGPLTDDSPIPTTTIPASPPDTTKTTPDGAPQITQWAAPRRFWCMSAHPGQAQVTLGWSAPSATAVDVLLDGRVLHQGLRKRLPFAVLAGTPTGIGVTVVFACDAGRAHRVTVRWRKDASPAVTKTATIVRAR